jgi:hypothetical protein
MAVLVVVVVLRLDPEDIALDEEVDVLLAAARRVDAELVAFPDDVAEVDEEDFKGQSGGGDAAEVGDFSLEAERLFCFEGEDDELGDTEDPAPLNEPADEEEDLSAKPIGGDFVDMLSEGLDDTANELFCIVVSTDLEGALTRMLFFI